MARGSRWMLAGALVAALAGGAGAQLVVDEGTQTCDTHPTADVPITTSSYNGAGGMAGSGWDGGGQNAFTLFWHVEGTTNDIAQAQRAALIEAMQAWADVVQITFRELPVKNITNTIDFHFVTGDHSGNEPVEAGDPDCPFDGPNGTLAHAGFPPGVNATCPGNVTESFAGNVHFDDAETWEKNNGSGPGPDNLKFVACHEIGHAIGLTHGAAGDIMVASIGTDIAFPGLSANDIANIQGGYAAGTGSVVTLEEEPIWIDGDFNGPATEIGTIIQPLNTIGEGVAGVPPFTTDVTLNILPATYSEGAQTITKACVLNGLLGGVVIN